jgi:hypothetical protein
MELFQGLVLCAIGEKWQLAMLIVKASLMVLGLKEQLENPMEEFLHELNIRGMTGTNPIWNLKAHPVFPVSVAFFVWYSVQLKKRKKTTKRVRH